MTRILKLLILCMFCSIGMVHAQSKYMNVPDTVCMALAGGTSDQGKFTSVNAVMTGGTNYTYPANATWTITTPSGSNADYNILYSANIAPLKTAKLVNTKSLTLEFLRAGTYTFKAVFSYKINNGATQYDSITKVLVATDCTIAVCNGGNAVMAGFNEDFGTMDPAVNRRPYPVTGVVLYDYQATGDLNDDYYTISSSTNQRGGWLNKPDHTGNTNGAMLVVNSAIKPIQMYKKKVSGLCSGAVYNFSAWLLNVNTESSFESGCVSAYQYAGVTFQVVDANNPSVELARFRTYAVSMMLPSANYKWQRYGGKFTTPPGVTDVLVRILNNKPGGCGNDIAIDDISFTYCSPIITAGLNNNGGTFQEVLCQGTPDTLSSSILPAGYFKDPVYQWEMSDNNGVSWFNVPFGTTRDSLLKIPAGQLKGTKTIAADYLFRVRIYEKGIPDSLGCGNPSSPIKLTILPSPILSLTQSRVCAGADVDLEASGGYDRFTWSDLLGYEQPTRTITVTKDTSVTVYGYVYFGEGGGKTCVDSNKALILADNKPIVEVVAVKPDICLGETVDYKINGTNAGKQIRWYRGIKDMAGYPDTVLMQEWNDATEIQVQPTSLNDTVYSVIVKSATCEVGSTPLIVHITPVPTIIRFPDLISCSSANSDGLFILPDSSMTAPHTNETGSWSIVSYTGINPAPDETIEDYIKINVPRNMGTRVTIPFGSTVVLGWTAKAKSNAGCSFTSNITLTLQNDPTYSNAGEDSTHCGAFDVFTMNASVPDATLTGPAAETGTWTLISGSATIADIHSPTTTVTLAGTGDAVLSWTITNTAGCSANADEVTLRLTPPPTASIQPIEICNTAGTFLVDSITTTGNPTRYTLKAGTPALPGFVTVSDTLIWPITAAYPTGTLPAAGVYNFILTVATDNLGCTTDVPFAVNITTPPTDPTGVTVGTPNICDTGVTVLTVTGGSLGKKSDGVTDNAKWMWYKDACGGTPIDSGVTITVDSITATTTYYVRAEGICGTTACANGVVTVYQKPAKPDVGADIAHCNDPLFTMTAPAPTVGTGSWSMISGTATITTPSSPTTTVNVTAGNTATLQWTVTNGLCVVRDTIILTNSANIVANAGPDLNNCNNTAFTMAANSAGVGTGLWNLISGTATIATAASRISAVTVPVGATATLRWTITNGTCMTTDDVVLTNYATPTVADAGPAQLHCNVAAFTMAGNIPAVGTGLWTVAAGTATIANPADRLTTVTVAAGNTATLQWTISNGTCPPSSSTVVLTNYAAPTPITPAPDQTHCNVATFTMAATPASVGTGIWTIVTGTATIANTSSPTTTVTVAAGNTATLLWTITNGTCVLTDDVVLTNHLNIVSNAGPDQQHCNNDAFTMAANPATPGTGSWSIVSGTATIADPADRLTTVTVAAGATATLRWTITNGTCSTTDDVVLTNFATPTVSDAGLAQTHCNVATFTMTANTPAVGTGAWNLVTGAATIALPGSPTTTVTVTAGNTATLQWTISNGTCPSSSSTVILTNNLNIVANAGPDLNNCNNAAFTMAANPATPGTGSWSVVSGAATIALPASQTSAVTVAAGTTATLRWTITNGTCMTTDDVVLTNAATPTVADAGPAQLHCNVAAFTMAGNIPAVGTGLWTVAAGTATIANPADRLTTVTVAAGSTATLQWTISNGTCPPSSSTVVLTNYAAPTPITPAPDQTHCNVATFTMAATPASVGTGIWTIVTGTATIANTSSPTTTVTVAAGNTATLLWTITNGTCVLTDDVVLTNHLNIVSNAGPDQQHCNNDAFTMAANPATPGTGAWSIVSGTATIALAASQTSAVTVPAGATATLRWTITNGTCSTTDDVILTNFATPTVADAGPAQTHCNVATFTMAANTATVGTGLWTLVSGTATIALPTSRTTTVTVAAGNTATLQWAISNGTCPPTTSTVVLTNTAPPTVAAAGPDQSHCLDPNFTLAANIPAVGTGSWSIVSGTATIALPASPTSAATVATGNSAILRWTITNGTCTSTDDVEIRNEPKAVDAAAGVDQEHCGDPVFTLAGNTPDLPSAVGTWTVVSPASVTIAAADIHKTNPVVNVPGGVTAILTWTIANGTCSTSDNVTLSNFGPVAGNTISADQTLCATETPAPLQGGTVSGGKGAGTYTYQWTYSVDNISYTNVAGATNPTYAPGVITQDTWFKRIVTSGTCAPVTSNAVKLTLINKPPAVVTVPNAITTDCIAGKDYRVMFGMPTFSHAPYSNEALTVTFVDLDQSVDACTRTIRRTWTATDRCGLSTSAQQTITITDKTAPVFTGAAPANITVDCDKVPALVNLTANDACEGLMSVTPTEVRQNLPGACVSNYQLIRTWVVSDGCGNTSNTITQTITVRDITAPVFNTPPPANISVDCDKIPAKTDLSATDNCTPGVITVTPVDSIATVPGACAQNYRIVRKWVATDLCGNTATLRQVITVQDTTRPVFSIPPPANITVDCDKVPALPTVTATDNCTATAITVTVGLKKELLSNTCPNNYRLTRTWTAKDNCGNTSIMSQIINVQDTTRPVFNVIPPADTTVSCDAIPAPSTNLTATDNCGTVKIAYTQSRQNITGACAANYLLLRTWTAKDECGNSTVIRQTITVADTTRPVIDPAPANITVLCGAAIQLPATLYARDNCDGTFPKKATMTEDVYTKDVCAGYTITRRWRIADACGNQAIDRIQTITVAPCPKPELDPNLPANCITNTKFAILLKNKVSKPKYTLVSATAVNTPLTQSSNVFDLQGSTEATFIVTDGVTGCVSDPVTYNLQYTMPPVITISSDTAICPNETVMLTVNPNGGNVRWSDGSVSNSIVVSRPGDYWATVTLDGCAVRDTVSVTLKSALALDLGPERSICTGGRVVVDGSNPDAVSYLWNDGTTDPVKEITEPGMYTISVMDRFCSSITMDSVNVKVTGLPSAVLPNDTTWCIGIPLVLSPNMEAATGIRWQDGSTSPTYTITIPGTYSVVIFNNCGSVTDQITVAMTDCDPKPQFPTGFTPNGDGHNDTFKPVVQGPMYDYDLHIFNRWGEIIFVSKEYQTGWNGKYLEKLVENGTYVWILSYKKKMGGQVIMAKGNITVLR